MREILKKGRMISKKEYIRKKKNRKRQTCRTFLPWQTHSLRTSEYENFHCLKMTKMRKRKMRRRKDPDHCHYLLIGSYDVWVKAGKTP